MRKPKKTRFSKKDQFEFILQSLRYALACRMPLFRVTQVRSKPIVPPEYPPVEVVIEMYGLPTVQGRRVKRAVPAQRLAEFFNVWKIQADFLKWYAKRIASTIPDDSSLAPYKRSLSRLTTGRQGKLPPTLSLKYQYQALVAQIKLLHYDFPNQCGAEVSPEQFEKIRKFGVGSNAAWVELVDKKIIYLGELFDVTPETAAKLILSKQYNCQETSIHNRLFRKV